MVVRIEIAPREGLFDARGHEVVQQAAQLGVPALGPVEVRDLYFLSGHELTEADVERVVHTLLLDPVVASARWMPLERARGGEGIVEVAPLPGTTDSEAESLMAAIGRLGIPSVQAAATGTRYALGGTDAATRGRLAAGLLANEVVERFVVDEAVEPGFVVPSEPDRTVHTVPITGLSDEGLLALSKERRLSLDLHEMRAIAARYRAESREPTDCELEMFAQTWSEHCVHKTFKAHVTLTEDGVTTVVDSMFKTYIAAATEAADSPWLESVFVDNAGIVGFEAGWSLAFKAETHNHPSALEPFGGANTGVGGVIRDILGVSARPIACTDVLCFGPPDLDASRLPEGVLHPRRVAQGVIDGVGDYGNKMGIPTVDGAIRYDRGYVANPLVFVGCLGVLPTGSHRTEPEPGDYVVSMGGRTGRDGLRGATFSSMEMDTDTSEIAGTSVQIGHPIHEKQVMEALLLCRDEELYTAVTDCGAGGLSSAVGEMAERLGARIHLERVPLKYPGLAPWEVWLSEAQERMVLAVPPKHWDRLVEICERHDVEASNLGTFTGDGRLLLTHGDLVVANLSMEALHEGIPQRRLQAVWNTPELSDPGELSSAHLIEDLCALLATPDIRSKEDVVRTYDHEVQGGTLVKPFVGPQLDGPSDATVLRPLDVVEATGEMGGKGAALSCGVNPNYGAIDPYGMAWAVVDEAVRNAVCVGADPDQMALLDNFCWGNPNLPDRLGGLVRAARGCFDAAVYFGAPYISGKDSLNNEYTDEDGTKHAIPGTLLISALCIVPDVDRTATMEFKRAGQAIYALGSTVDELGASAFLQLNGELGVELPAPKPHAMALARAVHGCIRDGVLNTAHDPSEGGLLVALAEMVYAGRLGADIDLAAVPWQGEGRSDVRIAFSESLARYVVAVDEGQASELEHRMKGLPCARIGSVTSSDALRLRGLDGQPAGTVTVETIGRAWRGHVG